MLYIKSIILLFCSYPFSGPLFHPRENQRPWKYGPCVLQNLALVIPLNFWCYTSYSFSNMPIKFPPQDLWTGHFLCFECSCPKYLKISIPHLLSFSLSSNFYVRICFQTFLANDSRIHIYGYFKLINSFPYIPKCTDRLPTIVFLP